MSLRKSLSNLAVLTLVAVALVALSAAPGLAQDQDEAIAYHGWFAANQVQDNAKAVEAAEAYLEKFPTGQYAEFLTKWLAPAKLSKLNEAIKAGQVDQMLEVGNGILANDPENLNVLYALAFQLRRQELLASPRSYAHATEAVDLSKKAIGLVESGKTLAGVQNFDKNATLAWLYQNLAMVAAKDGVSDAAIGALREVDEPGSPGSPDRRPQPWSTDPGAPGGLRRGGHGLQRPPGRGPQRGGAPGRGHGGAGRAERGGRRPDRRGRAVCGSRRSEEPPAGDAGSGLHRARERLQDAQP